MRLVFIDTETNDHPSKGADLRIVSITWLIARLDGAVEKIEDYIIRPDGFRIAYGAEQVHKISEAYARKHGHPIGDVLTMLVDDLQHPQGMTMVCHNVRFDRDVIGYELQRHGILFDIYSLPSFDTMKSTASICKLPKARGSGYKDPKLQELHAHLFGKEFENAHTSKADVEATARCFFELRRRGLFGEIGRGAANQQALPSRAQIAADTKKDITKKIQPLSDADAKVAKTPQARVEPAKQQAIAIVKPMASAEPARKVAIPQPVVAPPAKQPTETMVKPTPNAAGSIPAAANKMRGWIYLITNQAIPGHVLVDYCETDPIQQANKLNGPGAPFPYIVAYAALMTDPGGGVGLFKEKYGDKKQSGKWYSFAQSDAAAAIRELCEKQILYEDVQIETPIEDKKVSVPVSSADDAIKRITSDQDNAESHFAPLTLIDMHRKLAEQGDANAQFNMGKIYATGVGVAKDIDESVKWLSKAANKKHAGAFDLLSSIAKGDNKFTELLNNVRVLRLEVPLTGKLASAGCKNSDTVLPKMVALPKVVNADASYNPGVSYEEPSLTEQAIEAYKQAVRINPQDVDAWDNLGANYAEAGNNVLAIKAYKQVVRIKPQDAGAWHNLGVCYDTASQSDLAIQAYKKAVRINPQLVQAWANLGVRYEKVGQTVHAIEAFQQAVKINPQFSFAWYSLGAIYVEAGNNVLAIEAYKQVVRIQPHLAQAWHNLRVCFDKAGNTDQAREAYGHVVNQINEEINREKNKRR